MKNLGMKNYIVSHDNKLKCLHKLCKKRSTPFVIKKDNAINPMLVDIGRLRQLFGFFQYEAPNTSSYICSHLSNEYHDRVLMEIQHTIKTGAIIFAPPNSTSADELKKVSLLGDSVCSYCKRLFCKRAHANNGIRESDLSCLLRHIRNSLAHGRVFVIHGGNQIYILFEDCVPQNKGNNNRISARILCTQADLKKWKSFIEMAIKEEKKESQN